MYRTHWGLRDTPFRGALDWRHYFASPTHDEALARLQFVVEEGRRMALLFGPVGGGKTMCLEVFARRLRRSGAQVANINLVGVDLREFLWLLAAELSINPGRQDDVFSLWRGILDRLAENRYQQLDTVLLLDDASQASQPVLEHIQRLAASDCTSGARLTIVLASTSFDAGRLPRALLELADLRIDLEPWEPADTVAYIAAALERAGRSAPAFTDDALQRLHDLCGGIPRRINQLANLALVAAAGQSVSQIDADTLDSAYRELGLVEAVA